MSPGTGEPTINPALTRQGSQRSTSARRASDRFRTGSDSVQQGDGRAAQPGAEKWPSRILVTCHNPAGSQRGDSAHPGKWKSAEGISAHPSSDDSAQPGAGIQPIRVSQIRTSQADPAHPGQQIRTSRDKELGFDMGLSKVGPGLDLSAFFFILRYFISLLS